MAIKKLINQIDKSNLLFREPRNVIDAKRSKSTIRRRDDDNLYINDDARTVNIRPDVSKKNNQKICSRNVVELCICTLLN